MLTVVYTTFFPNDETQILFLDSDDIPPIPYHGRELTNIGLLDALFRHKIPIGPDAPDADASDAFYRHPSLYGSFIFFFFGVWSNFNKLKTPD